MLVACLAVFVGIGAHQSAGTELKEPFHNQFSSAPSSGSEMDGGAAGGDTLAREAGSADAMGQADEVDGRTNGQVDEPAFTTERSVATNSMSPAELSSLSGSEILKAGGEYVSDEVLVQLPEDGIDDACAKALSELGLSDAFDAAGDATLGWITVELPAGMNVAGALDGLAELGMTAQPNYVYHLLDESSGGSSESTSDKAAAVPTGNSQVVSTQDDSSSLSASLQTGAPIELNSDPFAVKQREGRSAGTTNYWWMKATGVFDAWKIQESSASVTVAVLDTGCDVSHKDLSAGQIVGQWNVVDKNDNVADALGHGTHVAGIIAATVNNDKGLAGVSKDARIMPVKLMGSENTTSSDYLLDALHYVMQRAKAYNVRVLNMSIGGSGGYDIAALRAIDKAYYTYGILPVMAAGNASSAPVDDRGKPKMPYYCFPCDFSEVGVGVINAKSGGSSYSWTSMRHVLSSNYNVKNEKTKDLAAPGTNIWSTWPSGVAIGSGSSLSDMPGYGALTGTSMATPVVSGVAALMFAANPRLLPGEAKSVLCTTAQDMAYTLSYETVKKGFDAYTGYGFVRADLAVAAARSGFLRGASAVAAGKTIRLSVPAGQGGTWVWDSLDPSIAEVDGGLVRGISNGEAIIRARRTSPVSAAEASTTGRLNVLYRTITVYDAKMTAPSAMFVGAKEEFKLKTGRISGYTWASSNTAVAKVGSTSGYVTALKPGTATITATLSAAPRISISKKITVKRSIAKARVKLSKSAYVFDGKVKTPAVSSVVYGGTKLKAGTDYKVTYAKGRKYVGTYTVSIKGIGAYGGSVAKKFTIKKAKNPLAVKPAGKTVNVYALAQQSVKTTRAVIFTRKPKGAVTYAKVAAKSSEQLSIQKKVGNIIVKRGTPRGIYRICVKVRAAGTANYKAGASTVTVVVKVV